MTSQGSPGTVRVAVTYQGSPGTVSVAMTSQDSTGIVRVPMTLLYVVVLFMASLNAYETMPHPACLYVHLSLASGMQPLSMQEFCLLYSTHTSSSKLGGIVQHRHI